jgi:uncharacterized iron-regulated protein
MLRHARPTPGMKAAPALPPDAVVVEAPSGAAVGAEALGAALADARLVIVGEKHDEPLHHLVQAEVLKLMHARRPGVQLGLEMLDYTKQPDLDAYLSGAMSEADFAAFWKKNWGFDFALYRPVLDYARRGGIRVRALNAPPEIVKQVAKGGLSSLTPEQRAAIPADIFPIVDPRYLAYVKESLGGHGSKSLLLKRFRALGMPTGRMERMLEAMQVWNNTMGERALASLSDGPMLVIVGAGHAVYRAGILESVRARTGAGPEADGMRVAPATGLSAASATRAEDGMRVAPATGLSAASATRAEDGMRVVLPYPQDGESLSVEEALARLRSPDSKELELADRFWLLSK